MFGHISAYNKSVLETLFYAELTGTTCSAVVNSSGILDWPEDVLTLALDETITKNFKICSDVFIQPMFSNYRMLALDELFTKILKPNFDWPV